MPYGQLLRLAKSGRSLAEIAANSEAIRNPAAMPTL